ncbi:MAG: phosphotransferase family protein [Pseudomonadales bacterium]|nr:phosphotransferase family protein [Pseudomonadales bacterium]
MMASQQPSGAPVDIRQAPTAEFIAELRRRYPTEAEIDRVLTRKMAQRGKGVFVPVTFEQISQCLEAMLHKKLNHGFRIVNARWMTGGSSKLQISFELEWQGLDGSQPRHITPMVLRMSPSESIVETSRRREFQVIKALAAQIPVPDCYWEDEDMEFFPYPAMVFGFVEGVAKPASDTSQQVTGLGINYGARLRTRVTDEFMGGVAAFHNADISTMDLNAFEIPKVGTNEGVRKQVNMWRRIWEEDRGEDEPLVQLAGNWLEDNAPVLDHVSIVHGDCRSGNYLISEDDGHITAWLDWELAVLGDRHQDLTWATSLAYSHIAEDGKTLLVNGMLPLDEFYAAYEKATGLNVDPQRINYFRVYNAWVSYIVCVATGYRVAKGGKSHQDIVLTWLNGIGGLLMEQLRHNLMEATR